MEKQLIGFLERCGRPRIYEPGEMIFRQGEDEDFLYFVEEGIALVYTVTEEGKERNVLISWPQHFSGLATFFEGGPHRSSAVAMETCKVSVISRRDFTRCCAEFPEIWGLIARELSREIGLLLQQTVDSSLRTAEERVACFFVRRYAEGRYEKTKRGIEMHFTQEFISRVLGLSRWAVNQGIKQLKGRGWLNTDYGKITITDLDAMLKFSKII